MEVAIITGGSRGLGRALARGLVDAGWALVIDGREAAPLEEAAAELRRVGAEAGRAVGGAGRSGGGAGRSGGEATVLAVAGDITDAAHREQLVAAAAGLGGIDLVVNNASVLGPSPQPTLDRYPLDVLRRVYEVNVLAPLALVQAGLPALREAPRGRVINVTSDAAAEPYAGWGGYGSSKAALDQVSAILGAEEPGLSVWAVDPGDLRTRLHQEAFPGEDISDRPLPETVVPALIELIGSGRPSGRVRVAA